MYHAALTIILINKGLSLKDIAIVQICLKVSIFFQMISYFIIFKASLFMLLCISWFI
uniref:Multidrug-efflux transporter n=1 Tax=Borreliella burgdorferi 297 TaxID=521009 RepID=A0A9N7G4H4_BORBG|nr:multidrug-efflux transporter [Borreliella burgdorferi 297]